VGSPVVFQLNIAALEYPCTTCQLWPGASTQNWYSGCWQPEALAEKVTAVPGTCGEAGAADAVTEVHGLIRA